MQRLLFGVLLLVLLGAYPGLGRAEGGPACEMPADLITPPDPLSRVANALKTKAGLDILALGSGSTVGDLGGVGGSPMVSRTSHRSFPYAMTDALQALRPGVHVQLTVKGGRSMTADDMLAILHQELAAHHYDLVLWQTGTVEAVRGVRPNLLREQLQDGVDAVSQAQADLVLIDPQFSRFLRANADLGPYETVLQQMTGNPDVTMFHRLDLTQTWVGSGQIDLERVARGERDRTIALLNTCLGEALARFVLAGAGEH